MQKHFSKLLVVARAAQTKSSLLSFPKTISAQAFIRPFSSLETQTPIEEEPVSGVELTS